MTIILQPVRKSLPDPLLVRDVLPGGVTCSAGSGHLFGGAGETVAAYGRATDAPSSPT